MLINNWFGSEPWKLKVALAAHMETYELQKDDSTYKPTPPNFNSRIAYQKSAGQLSADIIKELFT